MPQGGTRAPACAPSGAAGPLASGRVPAPRARLASGGGSAPRTARELARATLGSGHRGEDHAAVERCTQACGEFLRAACRRDLAALGLRSSKRPERAAFLLGALIGVQQALRARGLWRGARVGSGSWRERLAHLLTAEFELIEGFAPREFAHRAIHLLETLSQDAEGYNDRYRTRAPALSLARLYGRLVAGETGASRRRGPAAPPATAVWLETAIETLGYARSVARASRAVRERALSAGRRPGRSASAPTRRGA